ncbi:MAG: integrase family protein, partial [bacterium]|nr:integrase family protein [bacterium]
MGPGNTGVIQAYSTLQKSSIDSTFRDVSLGSVCSMIPRECCPGVAPTLSGRDGQRMSTSSILSRFTMESIKRLPPAEPGKRTSHRHPRIEGLVIRVTEKGTKTFCFVGRPRGGAMVRKTLGTFPTMTVDQAERMAKEIQTTFARGEVPVQKTDIRETLGDLIEWYISLAGARKESTNQYYRYLAKQYLKHLAKRRADSIKRSDLADLHQSLSQKGKPYLANRLVALVRAAYQAAITEDRFSGTNPAATLKMNREHSRENRLLASQIPAVIDAVDKYPDLVMRAFFMLAFLTGQRK